MCSCKLVRSCQVAVCVLLVSLSLRLARADNCDHYCTTVYMLYRCIENDCNIAWYPWCEPCRCSGCVCVYVGDYGTCQDTAVTQWLAPSDCPPACDCYQRLFVEGQLSTATDFYEEEEGVPVSECR